LAFCYCRLTFIVDLGSGVADHCQGLLSIAVAIVRGRQSQANERPAEGMMPPTLESALRRLATNKHTKPLDLLSHAIADPHGHTAADLAPLIRPTVSIDGGTAEIRAFAVWGLIIDQIGRIGPSSESRLRSVLVAAFRLPHPLGSPEQWSTNIGDRFRQVLDVPRVFSDPKPSTTAPVHKLWRQALVGKLVPALEIRLAELAKDGPGWHPYVLIGSGADQATANGNGYRTPSEGAQPVFVDLFVTTVFLQGRVARRRITERLVTAAEDHVDSYLATALAGPTDDKEDLPVRSLWGCRVERRSTAWSGGVLLTRLVFPRPLRHGERHYFASEAIDASLSEERVGVNVLVDHHGVAPGQVANGCVPVSGLTIRVVFDERYIPEACWWHAEQTPREQQIRPPDGHARLLTPVGNTLQHTFTARCQPRETYGISFDWGKHATPQH
jgi:hypothetical protein